MAVSFAHIYNKYQYSVRFREIPILPHSIEKALSGALLSGVLLIANTLSAINYADFKDMHKEIINSVHIVRFPCTRDFGDAYFNVRNESLTNSELFKYIV